MATTATAKIPMQPGLSLGSIVKWDVVEKLQDYGDKIADFEDVANRINQLEMELNRLDAKINSLKETNSSSSNASKDTASRATAAVKKFHEKQRDLTIKQIDQLTKKLEADAEKIASVSLPVFSNVTSSYQTPLDITASGEITTSRGFDSIRFHSEYYDTNQTEERFQEKMTASSRASEVSGNVSFGSGLWKAKGSFSHSWSNASMDRVSQIKASGFASAIWVINAVVTTRHVRQLKKLTYDPQKLQSLLNIMKTGSEEDQKKLGISNSDTNARGKTDKKVCMLTEAVMGGAFTGIVTFLKKDSAQRDLDSHAKHSSSSTSWKAGGGWGPISVGTSGSHSRQNSSESEDDHARSRGDVNVEIEFVAQGVVPQLVRNTVVRETMKFQDRNFKKFAAVGGEKEDTSARQQELQQALYSSLNDIHSTKTEKQELQIHTPESLMRAYDDFCGEIVSDGECGVPIGFNYTLLSQREIEVMLNDSNLGAPAPEKNEGSSASASTKPKDSKPAEKEKQKEQVLDNTK